MANKLAFTTARVDTFTCEAGKQQALFWDAKTPGLGLRVTGSGARSYIFESRLFGKTIRLTIGDARTWDLGRARTEASRLKTLVDDGKDPREIREEAKLAHQARQDAVRRSDLTFGEAWDSYLVARRQHWGARHYTDHVKHCQDGGQKKLRGNGLTQAGPLAALRPEKLGELTGERISVWLTQESQSRPTMSALSYRLLRGFIRWTHDTPQFKGIVPTDAYKTRAVSDAVPRVRAKEGDVLQREQLSAWFKAVRSLDNRVASAYLQGLLITGARREELAAVRRKDVDFEWRSLVLNDKVEGTGGRTIPLPRYLCNLLKDLRAATGRTSDDPEVDWLFPSPTAADGRIAEPRSAHTRALQAAQLPHVSIQGLRRSFGTLAEWCEVPVGVVAQIQGHKPSAIAEKHYRRRPLDLLRMWHDKIETWMLQEAGVLGSGETTSKDTKLPSEF